MLIPALMTVAGLIVLFVIVVSLRPNTFHVTRSITMAAPAARPYELVNDFHRWGAWSPWAKLDPGMKQTYEGASSGTGAIHSWNGGGNVGEGRQTILESRMNELIRIKLEFFRPFKGTNAVEFTFQPQGSQAVVTWSMSGNYNFFTKAFGLFMDMDKMIGGNFEKGLIDMKSLAESA